MQRTIISLQEQDNAWLAMQAKKLNITKTALIREALAEYRKHHSKENANSLLGMLAQTQGIAQFKDGLDYQNELRDEW